MAKSITYNSFSLQDSNFRTRDIIYRNLPSKVVDVKPRSRRDGFVVVQTYYESKEIVISGILTRDTEANLKTSIDSLKEALNIDESNLDIGDGAGTMRFVASVKSINIPEEHYNITSIPYEIIFLAQPFGKATSTSVDTTTDITTSPKTGSFDPVGSVGPLPTIKLLVVGVPSAAITQIVFANTTTGESITIPSLVLDDNGDYLSIDCDAMTVTRSYSGSSASIDFTGTFPSFLATSNSYSLTITCAGSFNITQTITYYPLYL